MDEVIKALEVTAHSVRGCGLLSCAETIDWAVKRMREIQSSASSPRSNHTPTGEEA